MKIKVKGYLTFRDAMHRLSLSEIEIPGASLRSLFELLCKRHGEGFTDLVFDPATGSVRDDIRILLNGRHVMHLPNGLDTELGDGDEIALFPPVAGG